MSDVKINNGKVQCPKCSERVTPRLWHSDMNSLILNRSNKHLCPICGATMYETGGGVTGIFKYGLCCIAAIVVASVAYSPIFELLQSFGVFLNDAKFYSKMGAIYVGICTLYIVSTLWLSRGYWSSIRKGLFILLSIITFIDALVICVLEWFVWNEERGVFKERDIGLVDLPSLLICLFIALVITYAFDKIFGEASGKNDG